MWSFNTLKMDITVGGDWNVSSSVFQRQLEGLSFAVFTVQYKSQDSEPTRRTATMTEILGFAVAIATGNKPRAINIQPGSPSGASQTQSITSNSGSISLNFWRYQNQSCQKFSKIDLKLVVLQKKASRSF